MPGYTVARGSKARLRDLSLDLAQIALDVAGFVDPTPISDGTNAVISVARGDWFGAGIGAVSIVPYVGDLAKAGKFPKYLKTLEQAVAMASESAEAAKLLSPIMVRVRQALDLLPDAAGPHLAKLRALVDEFFRVAGAKTAARLLPDVSGQFAFRTFERNGYVYSEAAGRLGVPGKVKTHRSKSAQSSVSSGTGDDAGHLIGNQFGAPGGTENLMPQHWLTNRAGSFKQLEMEWAMKLKMGVGIEVKVLDIAKKGDARPFQRAVEWTEISPSGHATKHELTFMNPHSPRSRDMQNIPPTVRTPQTDNLIEVDFVERRRVP